MIDWKFRDEFQNWLYDVPRSHSANNVSKIFEVLKKFLKLSFKDKHHTNTIFQESDFGVKRVKVRTKIRLTPEEVEKTMKADFSNSPHLGRVRDMFIAACYSGLRISDWKHISHAGRRTFASNRYLEGWSLRKIMNILGHASEKQTEEYMDISNWELTERDVKVVEMLEYMKAKKAKESRK